MLDALSLFGAAFSGFVVAGIVQKILNVFLDRYLVSPLSNGLGKFDTAILSYLKELHEKEKRDIDKVEKEIQELRERRS